MVSILEEYFMEMNFFYAFYFLHNFGFVTVPISVVASTKKMKSLISNNHMLAQTLRSSSKLVSSCLIK